MGWCSYNKAAETWAPSSKRLSCVAIHPAIILESSQVRPNPAGWFQEDGSWWALNQQHRGGDTHSHFYRRSLSLPSSTEKSSLRRVYSWICLNCQNLWQMCWGRMSVCVTGVVGFIDSKQVCVFKESTGFGSTDLQTLIPLIPFWAVLLCLIIRGPFCEMTKTWHQFSLNFREYITTLFKWFPLFYMAKLIMLQCVHRNWPFCKFLNYCQTERLLGSAKILQLQHEIHSFIFF